MKSSVKKLLSLVLCAALLMSLLTAGAMAATPETDPGKILPEAYALSEGASLSYTATLTGEIVEVKTPYNEDYDNITVTIEVSGFQTMPIVCYRLKGEGAHLLALGDTITVTGTITNYNGRI